MRSDEYYERLDGLIYDLLCIDQTMGLIEMQRHLEQNNFKIGDPFGMLAKRRKKVMHRMISDASRMTKIINAAEYNTKVNSSLKELAKLVKDPGTPPGVKARAAEAITNISHKRLMTFTLLNIYITDLPNAIVGEKQAPDETMDTIMEAINVNQMQPRGGAFKYLPDSQIDPNANDRPKPTIEIKPTTTAEFATLAPLRNDRSFSVPKK